MMTSEQLEVANHCKDFKATHLNHKIFENTLESILGKDLTANKDHQVTHVKEFKFKTDDRVRKRDKKACDKQQLDLSEVSSKKQSKNSAKKINIVSQGSKNSKEYVFKPTKPKGPNLSTLKRKRLRQDVEEQAIVSAKSSLKLVNVLQKDETKGAMQKLQLTKPVEFSFLTEERIKKAKAAEDSHDKAQKYVFKASKVPKFEKFFKAKLPSRKITKGKAPVLASDKRCKLRKEREQQKIDIMAAKEVQIEITTEFEATIKSSPQVRLFNGDNSIRAEEDDAVIVTKFNDDESINC